MAGLHAQIQLLPAAMAVLASSLARSARSATALLPFDLAPQHLNRIVFLLDRQVQRVLLRCECSPGVATPMGMHICMPVRT